MSEAPHLGQDLGQDLGQVALLGTGLIGGSLAAALKRARLATRIVGFSGDADEALALGLVDEVAESAERAVAGCDTVILAAPVSVNSELLARIAPVLVPGVLLTDVSSVKMPVVAAALRHLGEALPGFVPCHPIAGGERSGPRAADPGLFEGRTVILSPLPSSAVDQVARLEAVWRRLGAVVERMQAEEHDRVYALVSHWPHAVSFALAGALSTSRVGDGLIGPGLRDLTRTAASSPALWADILMQNTGPVLEAADQVDHELAAIRQAVEARDREALIRLFERAAAWRRRVG